MNDSEHFVARKMIKSLIVTFLSINYCSRRCFLGMRDKNWKRMERSMKIIGEVINQSIDFDVDFDWKVGMFWNLF